MASLVKPHGSDVLKPLLLEGEERLEAAGIPGNHRRLQGTVL